MAEKKLWKPHRTTAEGFVDVFARPRMSLRRKIGAIVAAMVLAPGAGIQADIVYSEATTVQTSPNTYLAQGSIPCEDVEAVIFVDPGFGIQNANLTAEKVAPIANNYNMCTEYVTYGTTYNIDVLADKKAEVLRKSRVMTQIFHPELKPNAIDIGESLGGIVAAQTRNRMIEKFGDEFNYPVQFDDATPEGSESLRWGNPTVAELVARNCSWIKVGDFVMTLATVLTDQNEQRKSQLFDDRRDDYFWRVYKETQKGTMQGRIRASCTAGRGYPVLIKQNNTDKQRTKILYAYTDEDPIVDGNISKDVIKERSGGNFEEIHMEGNGIEMFHASAWDEWAKYRPYYEGAIRRMNQIIDNREDTTWYRKAPYIPLPR